MSPLEFIVPVTGFPFFHPKDSTTLTEVLGIETCKSYGHFIRQSGIWTITSLPIKIKADTAILQLRSRDVTICPDLDVEHGHGSLYRKRTLSVTEDGVSKDQSPTKRIARANSSTTEEWYAICSSAADVWY